MAENQTIPNRDGSVSFVAGSHAPFGELPVTPIYPEDPARWHPQLIDEKDVCERYGVTVDELKAWQQFGFPEPTRVAERTRFGSWRVEIIRQWDPEKLETWKTQIRTIAARLPK
jgi:hypothetical protein